MLAISVAALMSNFALIRSSSIAALLEIHKSSAAIISSATTVDVFPVALTSAWING